MYKMAKLLFTTSWDDGHTLDMRIAKLLGRYELKGTFYVLPPNEREDALSEEQIRELSAQHEIGAHTLAHKNLPTLSPERMREETAGSKAWVEQVTEKPCPMFCYPRGDYNANAIAAVREAGFRAARTVEPLQFVGSQAFLLPTTLQVYPFPWRPRRTRWWHILDPLGPLRAKAVRIAGLSVPLSSLKTWQSFAQALLLHAKRQQLPFFHLWGHAKEIDRYNQWDDLEQFFAFVRAQDIAPVTNYELAEVLRIV
jgi:peptidoglycan/xylan/chitin deacetylase (PgdA/CDA1 family)